MKRNNVFTKIFISSFAVSVLAIACAAITQHHQKVVEAKAADETISVNLFSYFDNVDPWKSPDNIHPSNYSTGSVNLGDMTLTVSENVDGGGVSYLQQHGIVCLYNARLTFTPTDSTKYIKSLSLSLGVRADVGANINNNTLNMYDNADCTGNTIGAFTKPAWNLHDVALTDNSDSSIQTITIASTHPDGSSSWYNVENKVNLTYTLATVTSGGGEDPGTGEDPDPETPVDPDPGTGGEEVVDDPVTVDLLSEFKISEYNIEYNTDSIHPNVYKTGTISTDDFTLTISSNGKSTAGGGVAYSSPYGYVAINDAKITFTVKDTTKYIKSFMWGYTQFIYNGYLPVDNSNHSVSIYAGEDASGTALDTQTGNNINFNVSNTDTSVNSITVVDTFVGKQNWFTFPSNALTYTLATKTGGTVEPTPEEEANAFAATFLENVTCSGTGSVTNNGWAELTTIHAELSEDAKDILATTLVLEADKELNDLNRAIYRYDYIINKYGVDSYPDFLGRAAANTVVYTSPVGFFATNNDNNSSTMFVISLVGMAAAAGIIVYMGQAKKRNKSEK